MEYIYDESVRDKEPRVITTDESLYEISVMKDRVNQQILKCVKESAMDCFLYASSGEKKAIDEEPLVCYNYGVIKSNDFGSYPSLDTDISMEDYKNKKEMKVKLQKVTIKGKDYAYNKQNQELFDFDAYKRNETLILVGKLQGSKMVPI